MADEIKFAADLLESTAKATKNLNEIIRNVESIVGAFEKSAVIKVLNTTSVVAGTRWNGNGHRHGAFGSLLKVPLGPFDIDVIGSQTDEFLSGITGSLFYDLDGSSTVWHVRWVIPMFGENEAHASLSGPNAHWYTSVALPAGGGGTKVPFAFILAERAAVDEANREGDWRTCGDCKSLVYSLDRGLCPGRFERVERPVVVGTSGTTVGGQVRYRDHRPAGDVFWLGHTTPGPRREEKWSRCQRCKAVFYDGWDDNKGRCPSWETRSHVAEPGGFPYILQMNVAPRPDQQTDWRFCEKCLCLFYLPHNVDGDCAAGGVHKAGSDRYVLTRVPT
jgi:hypothetical protein